MNVQRDALILEIWYIFQIEAYWENMTAIITTTANE